MNLEKTYSSKELNEIIGYQGGTQNNSKEQLMTRCKNAGLIVEALDTPRGKPNQYKVIENNFLLPDEKWIDCICYNNWEVSNLGRVRRKNTKKLLGQLGADGYVTITGKTEKGEGNKTARYLVHRIVFLSFYPEYIERKDLVIDHINGKKGDNRLENLRPTSSLGNTKYRDENQIKLQSIIFQLVNKYGYELTEKKLKELL